MHKSISCNSLCASFGSLEVFLYRQLGTDLFVTSADSSPKSSELSAIKGICRYFDEKDSSTVFRPAKCPATDDTLLHSSADLHLPIVGKSSEEHLHQVRSIGR